MSTLKNMKLIFIVCTLILPITFTKADNNYDSITYRIKPDIQQKSLLVNVQFQGQFSDRIIIDLPYKWAGSNYTKQIKNVDVISKNADFVVHYDENHQLIIKLSNPSDLLEINYEIFSKKDNKFDIENMIILDDLIHTTGHTILAIPEIKNDLQKVNAQVIWEQIPNSWKVFSSHGVGNALEFNSTIPDLLHSLYIIGNVRDYRHNLNGKAVVLSLYGNFEFDDKKITNSAMNIIQTQRNFFKDFDFDNYLISLIEAPLENEKTASMGGIGLYNSFATYITKNITLEEYSTLFAHEHLHNWLGVKINNSEEALNYWWSEGFTDYYSRILSMRTGNLGYDDFIQQTNIILKNYYESPVINISNARIDKDFWNDYDIQKMPYLRGFTFAMNLNCRIKSKDIKNSTDKILHELFTNHKNTKFSNEIFFTLLNKHYGLKKEFWKLYIDDGKTIDLEVCRALLPIQKIDGIYQLKTSPSAEEARQIKAF